jgi:hypothetical protein
MKTIYKNVWGKSYEVLPYKMIASVVFPSEQGENKSQPDENKSKWDDVKSRWDDIKRKNLLERLYSKTHIIEKDAYDSDRFNLTPFLNNNDVVKENGRLKSFVEKVKKFSARSARI